MSTSSPVQDLYEFIPDASSYSEFFFSSLCSGNQSCVCVCVCVYVCVCVDTCTCIFTEQGPSGVWLQRNGANRPSHRLFASGVVVGDEMFIFGGQGPNGAVFNDLHAFNFKTQQWKLIVLPSVPPPPEGRYAHMMGMRGHKLYISGGVNAAKLALEDVFVLDLKPYPGSAILF